MSDKPWSGNVGEWGELYAACKLLGTGELSISESDAPYRLLALHRPEISGSSRYTVEGTDVRTGSNRGLIPRSEYTDAADLIRRSITRRTAGARTFSLAPEIQVQYQNRGWFGANFLQHVWGASFELHNSGRSGRTEGV